MQTPQASLDDLTILKTKFCNWRLSKKYNNQATPPELWKEAAKVCLGRKVTDVARELGLERKKLQTLVRGPKESVSQTIPEQAPLRFLPVSLVNERNDNHLKEMTITLQRPGGMSMKVCINGAADDQLHSLVTLFIKGGI